VFSRYCFIGGLATCVHYTVLLGLVKLVEIQPFLATAIGAIVGALFAYIGNKRFSFLSDAQHRVALPRFSIIAALGAIINSLLVWSGTMLMNWNYFIPQIAATLIVAVITYYLNRTWTFI